MKGDYGAQNVICNQLRVTTYETFIVVKGDIAAFFSVNTRVFIFNDAMKDFQFLRPVFKNLGKTLNYINRQGKIQVQFYVNKVLKF